MRRKSLAREFNGWTRGRGMRNQLVHFLDRHKGKELASLSKITKA